MKLLQNVKKIRKSDITHFCSRHKEVIALLLLTLISLILQSYFALNTWGHVYSDEVFQSLEMAHNMVYGYGHIPPEYRLEHSSFPNYAKSRSPLFPFIFTLPMLIGKFLNWNYWAVTIPLIRILMALNGCLITPSIYLLVKKSTNGNKLYAFLSSFIVSFSPLIMFESFRSVTNFFFVPWLFFSIYLYWNTIDKLANKKESLNTDSKFLFIRCKKAFEFKQYSRIFFLSFFIGLILYIRMDLIIGLVALLIFNFPYKRLKALLSQFLGFVCAFLLGGIVDLIFYEEFLVSPIHWFKFNIIEGHAEYFGTAPFYFYFTAVSGFLIIIGYLFCCIGFALLAYVDWRKKKIAREKNWLKTKITGTYLFAALFIYILYSLQIHKEFRFVYFGTIYLHICTAIISVIIVENLSKLIFKIVKKLKLKEENKPIKNRLKDKITKENITIILITILILLASVTNIYSASLTYWQERDEIARALAYVGQQEDSVGVIVLEPWYHGKMYSYLHKNISLETVPFIHQNTKWVNLRVLISVKYEIYNYVISTSLDTVNSTQINDILLPYNYSIVYEIDTRAAIYKYTG